MKHSNKKVKQSRRKMTRKLRKGGVWYNPRSWFKKSVKVAPVIGPTPDSPYNPNLSNENTYDYNTRLTPDLLYDNPSSLYSRQFSKKNTQESLISKLRQNNCDNINFFNIPKKIKCRNLKKQLKKQINTPLMIKNKTYNQ
jgi:hypothetical protein